DLEPRGEGGARVSAGGVAPVTRFARGLVVLTAILAALIGLQHFLVTHGSVALAPDGAWKGEIDFQREGRLDFRLAGPDDAVGVRVELGCDAAELELYASAGEPIRDVADAPHAITAAGDAREFVLDGLGVEPLAGTTWYFTALWPYTTGPRVAGRRLERA